MMILTGGVVERMARRNVGVEKVADPAPEGEVLHRPDQLRPHENHESPKLPRFRWTKKGFCEREWPFSPPNPLDTLDE